MDIQTRKVRFIEEYLRINDEALLNKLSELLRKERQRRLKSTLRPMTHQDLADKLTRSQQDIEAGRIHTPTEVEAYLKEHRLP